jgi:hypothetical protein
VLLLRLCLLQLLLPLGQATDQLWLLPRRRMLAAAGTAAATTY